MLCSRTRQAFANVALGSILAIQRDIFPLIFLVRILHTLNTYNC